MVQFVEQVHHFVPGFDVHAAGGFVQQQQFRVADQGSGQKDPLLLAAGEFPDVAAVEVGNAQPCHHFPGQFPVLLAMPGQQGIAAGAAHQHYFLDGYGKVPVDGFQLGDIAGRGAFAAGRRALHGHFAAEDPGRAQDGAQHSRFAGAAGAQQADKIAGHNPQADIGQYRLPLVAGGEVFQFDNGLPRPALVGKWM